MAHASRREPSNTGAGPLETNTSFALSQLPALRELLDELRPRLTALEASSTTPAPESDAARERRLYVETQSRKASERQGMSAGDSAGESSGRAVIPEELAALEDLVDSLKENDEDRMEE
jgi:kinetochore protein Mis12/MTW1